MNLQNLKALKRKFYSKSYEARLKHFIEAQREVSNQKLLQDYLLVKKGCFTMTARIESRKNDGGDTVISASEYLARRVLDSFGIKYYAQFVIGSHICDFYLPEYGCVLEIDGLAHNNSRVMKSDFVKMEKFLSLGIQLMSVESRDLRKSLVSICNSLKNHPVLSREEQLDNNVFIACTVLSLLDNYEPQSLAA